VSDFIAQIEALLGPETDYDRNQDVDNTSRGPIYDDVYDKDGNLIVGPSVMD
jgi:hypothetical protein